MTPLVLTFPLPPPSLTTSNPETNKQSKFLLSNKQIFMTNFGKNKPFLWSRQVSWLWHAKTHFPKPSPLDRQVKTRYGGCLVFTLTNTPTIKRRPLSPSCVLRSKGPNTSSFPYYGNAPSQLSLSTTTLTTPIGPVHKLRQSTRCTTRELTIRVYVLHNEVRMANDTKQLGTPCFD